MNRANKNANKQRPNGNRSLAQLGLMDMPALPTSMDGMMSDDFDDADLEDELRAMISSGGAPMPRSRPKPEKNKVSVANLQMTTSDLLNDEVSDLDEDDENDPDLLRELEDVMGEDNEVDEPMPQQTVPKISQASPNTLAVLENRLAAYVAVERDAKESNDVSKAKRYSRAINTLNNQIKMTKSGKTVDVNEIPPEPPKSAKRAPPPNPPEVVPCPRTSPVKLEVKDDPVPVVVPSMPKPMPPIPSQKPEVSAEASPAKSEDYMKKHSLLIERRNQYKQAALLSRKNGDKQSAVNYLRILKQFDPVIKALESGNPIDLSGMPPPPNMNEVQQQASASVQPPAESSSEDEEEAVPAPAAPLTPEEFTKALQERCHKFQQSATEAKEAGNSSKARRLERVVKQYQVAIKNSTSGRPVDFDNLPPAPGFPPLSAPVAAKMTTPASPPSSAPSSASAPQNKPTNDQPKPPNAKSPAPKVPPRQRPAAVKPAARRAPHLSRSLSKTPAQQEAFLRERYDLFRQAAKECLSNDDRQTAADYMKFAMQIEKLIEIAIQGLPVDLKSVPIPPQLKEDFEIIEVHDCIENMKGDAQKIYKSIQEDMNKQMEFCKNMAKINNDLGDVASAARFETMFVETKQELNMILNCAMRKDPVPKFHYEKRLFSVVQTSPSLTDEQMELVVIRGINYPGSDDSISTYVQYEFGYPTQENQTGKTHTIKHTKNPLYDQKFIFDIQRKDRSLARAFKRNSLKLEVFSKGGFLSSDSLLGNVKVPISILETKCELHETLDIMNGRRSTKGKLEIKVRVKNPILQKQVEKIQKLWLVLD